MFGPRLTTIFASRWKALWWAGGILVLAWQLVPEPEQAPPLRPLPLPITHGPKTAPQALANNDRKGESAPHIRCDGQWGALEDARSPLVVSCAGVAGNRCRPSGQARRLAPPS
jgi:hypothetical protein